MRGFLLFALALFYLSTPLNAQGPVDESVDVTWILRLREDVKGKPDDEVLSELLRAVETLAEATKQCQEGIQRNTDAVYRNGQILGKIAEIQRDGTGEETYFPTFLENMQRDLERLERVDENHTKQLKAEFQSFTDRFMRSIQGVVVVDNFARAKHLVIKINGVEHEISEDNCYSNALAVRVPFGKVTTQLCWVKDDYPREVKPVEDPKIWGTQDPTSNGHWKPITYRGRTWMIIPIKISGG